VKQFIDNGSGLPTMENTHQVAHAVDPDIKVAYVDRDSQAVSHSKNILQEGGSKETVRVMDSDLREPSALMQGIGDFIDFSQPVAIMLVAVMHFVEAPECYRLAGEYKDRMAGGSYLILSHSTADLLSGEQAQVIEDEYRRSNARIYLRSQQHVTRFFDGLDLLEPGVTDAATWRSGPVEAQTPMVWAGVGRKAAA
jgi:hypothetical protein